MENAKFHNEQELSAAFRSNGPAGVSEVFNELYKDLVDFANHLVRDIEEAHNLTVHSFVQLMEKRKDLTNRQQIKSFLYLATRNNCYMHLRKIRSTSRFKEEALYLGKEAFDEQPEYDFNVMDVEIIKALYAEIDKLPGQCRTIFKMRYIDEVPTIKIAQHLGIERKTVQNQIRKASKTIKIAFSSRKLYPASVPLFLITFLF